MIPPHVHSSNYHHIDQRHSGAAPDPNPSPSPSPSPSRCHWPDTGADPGHNNPLLGSGTAAILNPNPHGYNPNPGLGHNPNYSAILRVYFDPSSSSSSSSKPVHHIERHEIRDPDWGSDAMLHYGAGNPAAAAHVLYGHGQSSGAGMAASAAPGPGLVAEYKYKPSGNISLLGPTEAAAPSPHSSSPSLDAGISQEYSCSHVDSLNLLPLIPGAMAMEAAADPAGNHSDLLRGLQSNPNPNPNPNPNLLRGLQSNPNPNPNPNPNFNPNPNLNPNLNPNPSTNPNPNHVSYANYAALLAGMAGAGGELGLSPTTYAAPLQPTVIDLYNHQQQSNRHMIMLSPMQMRHETSNSIMQEAAQLCGLHNLSPALHSGTLGLNLGGRTYFSSDDLALGRLIGSKRLRPVLDHRHGYMMSSYHDDEFHRHELAPSALGLGFGMASAKTVQVHHQAMAAPLCQAEGCKADLSLAKHYHRRHKVCEYHSKASTVQVGAQTQRFCQQCSRFHMLAEFDDGKRSCRKRLADHNRRRRKPAAPSAFMTSTVVAGAGVGVGPANTSPGSWAGPGGPADNANGQAEGNETAHVAGQPGPGQPRDMARDSSVSSGSSSSNSGGGGGGGSENGC